MALHSIQYKPSANGVAVKAEMRLLHGGLEIHFDADHSLFCPYEDLCRGEAGSLPGYRWYRIGSPGGAVLMDRATQDLLVTYVPHLGSNWRRRVSDHPFAATMLALTACITLFVLMITTIAGSVLWLIPVEAEEKYGEWIYQEAKDLPALLGEQETRICENLDGRAALERLLERLRPEDARFSYRIDVWDSETANAFALPGGRMILLSGLIAEAGSAEEVAGVIAHEIGHVEARHALAQIVERQGLSLIASLFSGGGFFDASSLLLNGMMLSKGREAEREADQLALKLMARADIDARPFADFFARHEGGPLEEQWSFLSTHPISAERQAFIEAQALPGGHAMSGEDWRALRAICRAD